MILEVSKGMGAEWLGVWDYLDYNLLVWKYPVDPALILMW